MTMKRELIPYLLLFLVGGCLLWVQNAYSATFTVHHYDDGDPYILMEGSTEYGDSYRLETAYAWKQDQWST